jgi:hypothetical protein
LAVSILFVQSIQATAREQEAGSSFAVFPEADPAQFTPRHKKNAPLKMSVVSRLFLIKKSPPF